MKKARRGRRHMGWAVGSVAALSTLYIRRKIDMRLVVNEKEAIYNGFKILQDAGKVLAFTAHPDDLEIFMGGTLRLLSARGSHVTVVDVTDGEKGVNITNLARIRRQEQRRAADVLQVSDLRFLHLPDLNLTKVKAL